MRSRKLLRSVHMQLVPRPPLTIEFRLTDEQRDAMYASFKRISDECNIKPYQKNNATSPVMNQGDVNMMTGEYMWHHLPEEIKTALASIDRQDQPPVIIIRNLPFDKDLPATPKTYTEKFDKGGIVSELVCRGIAALTTPPDYDSPQHSFDFRNVVGTSEDDAHLFHIHGLGIDDQHNLIRAAHETRMIHDMIFCQRGIKNIPTCFGWHDEKLIGKAAHGNLPGIESVTLQEGDLVIFNNRRVMHGRDATHIKPGDKTNDRWLLAVSKMDVPPTTTRKPAASDAGDGTPVINAQQLLGIPIGALRNALKIVANLKF